MCQNWSSVYCMWLSWLRTWIVELNSLQTLLFFRTLDRGGWLSMLKYVKVVHAKAISSLPTMECSKVVVQSNRVFAYVFVSWNHSNKDNLVMILHNCLGHPNFTYLEHLISASFCNKKSQVFIVKFSSSTKTHVLNFYLIFILLLNLSLLSMKIFLDPQG